MSDSKKQCAKEEDVAVTTFRRYLRINTSQPNPDYGNEFIRNNHKWRYMFTRSCGDFSTGDSTGNWIGMWRSEGECGLTASCDVCIPQLSSGLPVVVMSCMGSDPSLQAVMLNSHMDVVPVFPVSDRTTVDITLFTISADLIISFSSSNTQNSSAWGWIYWLKCTISWKRDVQNESSVKVNLCISCVHEVQLNSCSPFTPFNRAPFNTLIEQSLVDGKHPYILL